MAVATFGAAFLARTATLGPVFFTGGFIIAYGLTFGDELLGLALQPATAGNAPQFELPEFVFVSPEEALVQTLLWLTLAAVMPLGVLIAANLLTGRDPARVLRDALAGRLATAARVCASEKGAELELEAQAFQGTAGLRKLHHLAGLMNRSRRIPVASVSLIDEIRRLGLLLVAWLRIEDNARDVLAPAAVFCRAAERALRTGEAPRVEPAAIAATGAARPLADAISRTLRMIAEILAAPPSAAAPAKAGDAARSARRLLAADAFSNPEHVRFALKLTMAVMTCYFIESLADWPSHWHLRAHLLHGRSRHGRRDAAQSDAAHRWRPDWRWARPGRDPAAHAADDKSRRPIPAARAGDPARRLDRVRDRAHRLCRSADRARFLSGRAARHWPNGRHVYRKGPRHRHPSWQRRDLRYIHDDLACECGKRCACERRQGIGGTRHIRRLGRADGAISQADRSAASMGFGQAIAQARGGPGQRSVRDKRGQARCRTAADRCNHCIADRSPLHPRRDDPRSHHPPGWSRPPAVNAGRDLSASPGAGGMVAAGGVMGAQRRGSGRGRR